MRVSSGLAKGRKLYSMPEGSGTRPITDRGKESLFNVLGKLLVDADFLDLFSGTGSVGIEALSRGARLACFVEDSRKAMRVINKNLEHTNLGNGAITLQTDVFKFLQAKATPYDIIFIAPPQYKQLWIRTLYLLDDCPGWIKDGGIVIVQIDPSEFESNQFTHLVLFEQKIYGNVSFCFYKQR